MGGEQWSSTWLHPVSFDNGLDIFPLNGRHRAYAVYGTRWHTLHTKIHLRCTHFKCAYLHVFSVVHLVRVVDQVVWVQSKISFIEETTNLVLLVQVTSTNRITVVNGSVSLCFWCTRGHSSIRRSFSRVQRSRFIQFRVARPFIRAGVMYKHPHLVSQTNLHASHLSIVSAGCIIVCRAIDSIYGRARAWCQWGNLS